MRPLAETSGHDLIWWHTDPFRAEYELRCEAEVVATLHYAKNLGTLAVGEAAEGRWILSQQGVLHPRVTARVDGFEMPVATVERAVLGWGGRGLLKWPNGMQFRWGPSAISLKYAFATLDGEVLVRFERLLFQGGWGRQGKEQARMAIATSALSMPGVSLLALLGWYLMVT